MTGTSRRPTLVPRWLIPSVAVILVVAGFLVAQALIVPPSDLVTVPSVTGLPGPVARSRLAQHGLLMDYGDTRFSALVPLGGVLEQDPGSGARIEKSRVVVVVVSAGSSTFVVPDVIGLPLTQARAQLEERGLTVEVRVAPSEAEKDTVISSLPAPGVKVETDSVVTLTIAGDVASDILLPDDLSGTVLLIDPVPPEEETADVAMEVTRHLRSLLEASGAEVMVTRSVVETAATVQTRAAWAADTSPDLAVALTAGDVPGGTRTVSSLPATPENADVYLASVDFARTLLERLMDIDEQASLAVPEFDEVLAAAGSPGATVSLGDPKDPANVETLSDPSWVDSIAQALYRAVADVLSDD